MKAIKIKRWTSDLIVNSDKEFELDKIEECLMFAEKYATIVGNKPSSTIPFTNHSDDLMAGAEYSEVLDTTYFMKGLALSYIMNYLKGIGSTSFIANFGGDMIIYNSSAKVHIANSSVYIDVPSHSTCSIFTSGNIPEEKGGRGDHIVGTTWRGTITTVRYWKEGEFIDLPAQDGYTTKLVADETTPLADKDADIICIDEEGKILNWTYCASPFFNPEQVAIRDRMISNFKSYFRPDQTESSKSYDLSPGKELAEQILLDNILGINRTEVTVYPAKTPDLGTLWEVGYSIAKGKMVCRYDDVDQTYHFIKVAFDSSKFTDSDAIEVDLSTLKGAINIGIASYYKLTNINHKLEIYYQLKGLNDNIMFCCFCHHVELENGKLVEYFRNPTDKDE